MAKEENIYLKLLDKGYSKKAIHGLIYLFVQADIKRKAAKQAAKPKPGN